MKRTLFVGALLAILMFVIGAVGANPHYIEELRIGGGLGDTADGGADLDKQGDIATDGWIDTTQQYRVNGSQISTQNLSNSSDVGMLNENESVTGAWTFTNGITNSYNSGVAGYTQNAREMVIGVNFTDARFCGQENVVLRAGYGGGNWSVFTQPTGTGGTYLNRYDGTGGVFFGSGAGANVGSVDADGNASFDGDVTAKAGHVDAGAADVTRGVLTGWSGAGGSAPGCLKLASPNGTVWYLFVEDDGTLKIHNTLPTQNSDGSIVGLQF